MLANADRLMQVVDGCVEGVAVLLGQFGERLQYGITQTVELAAAEDGVGQKPLELASAL
jgi:hypothetical protein